MRFGFMLLPRDPVETRAAARAGERAGFSWMGVADSPTVYQESYLHQLEAARVTSSLQVGPMVSHVVARHPVIVANLLATMAQLSGGRAVGTLATGNSAARGLGLKPARVDELAEAIAAIRGYWAGEGGAFGASRIPASGLRRTGCPLLVGADGPKAAQMSGAVADGIVYGGPMDREVRRRRLAAGVRRDGQEAWLAPCVSFGQTHDEVREDLGAMVVAMANRALRGDLDERNVPEDVQRDVREMRRAYDYGYHADSSRPRNTGVVSDRLAEYLIDSLCVWGDDARWRALAAELEEEGWTGIMFILGQAEQLSVVERLGERLSSLGLMTPAAVG
jgi:alkanesulfonate monooxygenase SsuD/methylene tetrahydromethanopterin reductase-like flavin-dependent oxidoreductase (luciferase family)